MDRIKDEYFRNIDLYKNTPSISRYILNNPKCILCIRDAIKPDSSSKDKQNKVVSIEKKKALTADYIHFINRLGISQIQNIQSIEIENDSSTMKVLDPVLTYLKFIECVNLDSSKSSIKVFDVTSFSDFFELGILDQNVSKFVEKLENDPVVYEKKDKSMFLNILILTFSFCNNKKINTEKLKSKINENSFFLNEKSNLKIEFQDNVLVDKLILQIKKNTADLSESFFMNKIYLNISRNREHFPFFHKRLIETLNILDDCVVISYLRHVFTFNTVLFSCIDEIQLLKLILSFYQNMNKMDFTVEILSVLYKKTHNVSVNDTIRIEISKLCKNSKKHTKLYKCIEIRSISTFEEFFELINSNKDSFDCMNMIFNDLKIISEYVSMQKTKIQLLGIFLYFFRNLKNEFVFRFFNSFIQNLIKIISGITDIDDDLLSFNKAYWDDLSDVLLTSHRISVENDETKKKKCQNIKETQTYKMSLRLAELLYKIEEKLRAKGIIDFKKLKEKGFKIESLN